MGVAFPRTADDIRRAIEIAGEAAVPVIPRGAGTSMSGQSIGRGLVLDTSRHLGEILDFDPGARRVVVQPGIVLDHLNEALEPHGLFFPVDVATSSRATLGGMAGNNSAGARSIRYGHTVEHVAGIRTVLADGTEAWFGKGDRGPPPPTPLETSMLALYARESEELARRVPAVPRNVAGYALHRLGRPDATLADLLVGSEGTLAFFTALELVLHPLPAHRVLGVCAFGSVRDALSAVPDLVALDPTAIELIDDTLLELAAGIPAFHGALGRIVASGGRRTGETRLPGAVLLIEFSGDDPAELRAALDRLDTVARATVGARLGIVRAEHPGEQSEIWGMRKAGLNIATSMKEPRKAIAFIEDCAIPLERLPEWHDRLTEVIDRHGTRAIWYAHASVGCLHVRPALDLKQPADVRRLRAIAEDAFAIARSLGGTHSGEHGDGIVRSEFLEPMLGPRIAAAFGEVKTAFDPRGLLNPGRIVDPPRMDDRELLRYFPGYRPRHLPTAFDWSEWRGFSGAVEMCNNNGACRKRSPGVMCPSYRATLDERHSTRGRANALRLALSGQLGEDPWSSPDLYEALDLCIGCKGCRRECPTGVDMSRMKIEFLARRRTHHGLTTRDRVLAWLPRYAPWAARAAPLFELRNRFAPLARAGERLLGLSADRPLPRWASRPFTDPGGEDPPSARTEVALFVDTFTRWFEPENARAAVRVLRAAGFRPQVPDAGGRPPCCGRTFLNVGMVAEARAELDRLVAAFAPYARRGIPIVGLEPSCLLTLRDELGALDAGADATAVSERARLLSELFVERGVDRLPLGPIEAAGLRVHGHCHEKAFGIAGATTAVLRGIPGQEVTMIPAGCCGMAGSFGYEREHADLSRSIAELELLPAVRDTAAETRLVANGTSCRHQIAGLAGRQAVHFVRVLDEALAPG